MESSKKNFIRHIYCHLQHVASDEWVGQCCSGIINFENSFTLVRPHLKVKSPEVQGTEFDSQLIQFWCSVKFNRKFANIFYTCIFDIHHPKSQQQQQQQTQPKPRPQQSFSKLVNRIMSSSCMVRNVGLSKPQSCIAEIECTIILKATQGLLLSSKVILNFCLRLRGYSRSKNYCAKKVASKRFQ